MKKTLVSYRVCKNVVGRGGYKRSGAGESVAVLNMVEELRK